MTDVAGSKFDSFCEAAFCFLEEAGVPYLVIGGLAVIVLGEPRTTGDVNVVVFLGLEAAEGLIRKAKDADFDLDVDQETKRLRQTGTLSFRRSRFHLDLTLASLPFEHEALRRSRPQRLFGRPVPFPTPEDLIVFKVLAGRDKDLLDAQGVLRRHKAKLDRKYIEDTLTSICDVAEDLAPWARLQECLRKAGLAEA